MAGHPPALSLTVVSYLPPTSPFVLTVSADANSRSLTGLATAESKIPFFAAIKAAELRQLPRPVEKDIKSLAGDPAAIGEAVGAGELRPAS